MGSNMAAGNQLTETPVKSVNLSLDKRKKTKRIRFLIYELSNCQILRNKSLFNQHDSSLGRHVNAATRSLSQNQGPILSENLYEY